LVGGEAWLPQNSPAAGKLLHSLGLTASSKPLEKNALLLVTNLAAYQEWADEIADAVRAGATAVLLNLPVGEYMLGGAKLQVRKAGMGSRHFVSRATGHSMVEDLQPDDFKFWHFDSLGHPAPILHTVLEGSDWTPVLQSGDGGWLRPWGHTPAAVERRDGQGRWLVCQIELARCVATNPVANLFARRLFADASEKKGDTERFSSVAAGKNGHTNAVFAKARA